MRPATAIALVVGVVFGATTAQVGLHLWRQYVFQPTPLVTPSFLADFSPEFLALIERLRTNGASDTALAAFVVADFDRQWEQASTTNWPSVPAKYAPGVESGRREAVRTVLGPVAVEAWREATAMRCLHPHRLGIDDCRARELYAIWDRWDRANQWPYTVTRPNHDPFRDWRKAELDQIRILIAHDSELKRILTCEQFVNYVEANRWPGILRAVPDSSKVGECEQSAKYTERLEALERALVYLEQNPSSAITPEVVKNAMTAPQPVWRSWFHRLFQE